MRWSYPNKSSSQSSQATSDTLYTNEAATLSERVAKAKSDNKKRVVFPGPIGFLAHVESFSQASNDYRVLVAELVAQKSYARSGDMIKTWNKFKILEDLSTGKAPTDFASATTDSLPEELDDSLLPIEADEILIFQMGGILNVDGVELVQETTHFPLLEVNQRYLLFVEKNQSEKARRMQLGPYGIFLIDQENLLSPLNEKPHPISLDIARKFGNSLGRIKTSLNKRPSQD